MDKEGKYRFSNKDRDEREDVCEHFEKWLEKHVGQPAADTFSAIRLHRLAQDGFAGYPESELTIQNKRGITYFKKELAKAAAWLKAEGCYG